MFLGLGIVGCSNLFLTCDFFFVLLDVTGVVFPCFVSDVCILKFFPWCLSIRNADVSTYIFTVD